MVAQTGKALTEIVAQVQNVSVNVIAIVDVAKEQAIGLKEINKAVNTMDLGTQQNAALVEQSTAASNNLAREAENLFSLIDRFKVGSPASSKPDLRLATVSSPRASVPSPAKKLRGKVANAFRGNSAVAAKDWEDF